ncbi:hypothetical protein [Marinitoga aeolica]|uniref:Outer membrane protein beta-barrel domain-containing protein n=1 Tax=Marinitoga aeolica TaxID=2809031 RepID=A0ABY8PSR0_9BACT|nr:hypothetical protein [Marinitoga aeolica]WGS65652.1 hypothetical protein JRV97_03610 [Marinitoga aeolica]
MKKIIIISLLIISVFGFAIKSDIVPQHEQGFFVNFENIGYSLSSIEISTAPLLDILGVYNIGFRYYLEKNIVLDLNGGIIDPFVLPSYFGEPRPTDGYLYIYYFNGYNHNNFNFGNFSLKTHIQPSLYGISMQINDVNNKPFNLGLNAITIKGFSQLGYYLADNLELFGGVEGGYLLSVNVNPDPNDPDFNQVIRKAKDESLYSIGRGGIRFYSGDVFGVELGYRITLVDGFLKFLQGYNATDYIYNSFSLTSIYTAILNEEDPFKDINIPFITTDYYLSFTVKF